VSLPGGFFKVEKGWENLRRFPCAVPPPQPAIGKPSFSLGMSRRDTRAADAKSLGYKRLLIYGI